MCVAVWLCGCVIGWWSAESGGSRCGESVHTCEFCSAGEGEKERGREEEKEVGGGGREPGSCCGQSRSGAVRVAVRGRRTGHSAAVPCLTQREAAYTRRERERQIETKDRSVDVRVA